MKQAILITAYTQLEFLKKIIDSFDQDFDFYIHIDRKSTVQDRFWETYPNVKVFSKFRIQWGSVKHLQAIFFLMKEAQKAAESYSYYHLITGSDCLIKPLSEFKSFFSQDNQNNYLEWFKLPRASWVMEGGLERVKYYWLGNTLFDIRGRLSKYVYKLVKYQRLLHVQRPFLKLYTTLYGGGGYWSLTSDAVDYLIRKIEEGHLMKYMRHTHCSEEILFHTLLLNAETHFPIVNDSLRYSKWEENARSPKFLDETDMKEILSSKCFFARKFRDDGLISRIQNMN